MVFPARPACGRRVCLIREDARVLPYKARVFRRLQGCPTRVQGLGVGGQLSNSVQSNVKSGEIGPYRRYSASTWVPEQLPAPLDSARNEIGQLSSGESGRFWTVPATKSDSLSNRWDRAGRVVGRGREALPGGSGQPAGWSGGGADQCAEDFGTIVVSDVGAPAGWANQRDSPASAVTFRTTAGRTGWQRKARTWRGSRGQAHSHVITCQS